MPATKSPGQAAGLERPGTGQDADGGRDWDRARCRQPNHRSRQRAWSCQGPGEMPAETEAGTERDADDQITGAGGGKINSKESAL